MLKKTYKFNPKIICLGNNDLRPILRGMMIRDVGVEKKIIRANEHGRSHEGIVFVQSLKIPTFIDV